MAGGIDIQTILGAAPGDAKAQGLSLAGKLILEQGLDIRNRLTPAVEDLASQVGIQGTTIPDICPDPILLARIIEKRNNIVSDLTNISVKLDRLGSQIDKANDFLTATQVTLTVLKTSKMAASVAAAILPTLPGAVGASLSNLEDAINRILFDQKGQPRIPKIQSGLDYASISVSITAKYVETIITSLELLDILIKQCSPNSSLLNIPSGLIETANSQTQAIPASYKGFIIEIEEVPFSNTVSRRRAVGKNSQGIVLVQTDLSFTTIPEILVDQLKFTIDSQNLKPF